MGQPVILIAGGYDKHIPYDPLGKAAATTVKAAILMGATADAIEKAIRKYGEVPVLRVADMEEAVREADTLAGKGDIVFMSPASASFDRYKNFEERGDHFKRLVGCPAVTERGMENGLGNRTQGAVLCRWGRRAE